MSTATAILALFLRDVRAVVRARSQIYSSVFTPLIFLVFLGTGVSEGLEPSRLPAGNYTAYLLSGVVVMAMVFSATFASASYYRDRDAGMLRLFLVTPHPARVILFGKSLAGVAIGAVQGLLVLLVAAPFVDLEWQYGVAPGVLIAVAATLLLGLLLAGVAQTLASRVETMQGFHLLMNLALFPLLFFSGAFFPIDNLPVWLEVMARLNPLTYGVDALQVAAYARDSEAFTGLGIDFAVLGVLAVVVYGAGLARTPALTWSGH